MRLYVEPMDAVVVDFDARGQVRFDDGEWSTPSLQERRAILYAAENERAALGELIDALDDASPARAPE